VTNEVAARGGITPIIFILTHLEAMMSGRDDVRLLASRADRVGEWNVGASLLKVLSHS